MYTSPSGITHPHNSWRFVTVGSTGIAMDAAWAFYVLVCVAIWGIGIKLRSGGVGQAHIYASFSLDPHSLISYKFDGLVQEKCCLAFTGHCPEVLLLMAIRCACSLQSLYFVGVTVQERKYAVVTLKLRGVQTALNSEARLLNAGDGGSREWTVISSVGFKANAHLTEIHGSTICSSRISFRPGRRMPGRPSAGTEKTNHSGFIVWRVARFDPYGIRTKSDRAISRAVTLRMGRAHPKTVQKTSGPMAAVHTTTGGGRRSGPDVEVVHNYRIRPMIIVINACRDYVDLVGA